MKKVKIFLLNILAIIASSVSLFFYDTADIIGTFAEKVDKKAENLASE